MYDEYQRFRSGNSIVGWTGRMPTSADIEGPFYKPGSPFSRKLASEPSLILQGIVMDTEGNSVVRALLDFWQADEEGVYDLLGFDYRARQEADEAGRYRLDTVIPGNYEIAPDESRCAHIHVKVTAPGFKPLTTQLYFADDEHNETDRWFSPDRVIRYTRRAGEGRFDFIMEPEPR